MAVLYVILIVVLLLLSLVLIPVTPVLGIAGVLLCILGFATRKQVFAAQAKADAEKALRKQAHAVKSQTQMTEKEKQEQIKSAMLARQEATRLRAQEEAAKLADCTPLEMHVAGVSYCQDSIASLGSENPDYSLSVRELKTEEMTDVDIYRYDFPGSFRVDLIPDPSNEYDSSAVKVFLDSIFVGYIPENYSEKISCALNNGLIYKSKAKIIGGPSKNYDSYNEEFDMDDDRLFGILLTVYIKDNTSL